jgi:DNA-nicking Smr family endonuclease
MQAADGDGVPVPIEGTLDLHTFRPSEAVAAVEAFLDESQKRGWGEVRIVHGKGTGALREKVQAYLRRSPFVASYRMGNETSGGWGATLVALQKK